MLPKVIVVSGPQGSGKSVTACGLAASVGKYNVTTMAELQSGPFALGNVMKGEPETIIVEECGLHLRDITTMKELVSHDRTRVERKHQGAVACDTPRFIFCMAANAKPGALRQSRHFVEVVLQATP